MQHRCDLGSLQSTCSHACIRLLLFWVRGTRYGCVMLQGKLGKHQACVRLNVPQPQLLRPRQAPALHDA